MRGLIARYRISLFYISMGLVMILSYVHQHYWEIVYGMIAMLFIGLIRKHTSFIQCFQHWF